MYAISHIQGVHILSENQEFFLIFETKNKRESFACCVII